MTHTAGRLERRNDPGPKLKQGTILSKDSGMLIESLAPRSEGLSSQTAATEIASSAFLDPWCIDMSPSGPKLIPWIWIEQGTNMATVQQPRKA